MERRPNTDFRRCDRHFGVAKVFGHHAFAFAWASHTPTSSHADAFHTPNASSCTGCSLLRTAKAQLSTKCKTDPQCQQTNIAQNTPWLLHLGVESN